MPLLFTIIIYQYCHFLMQAELKSIESRMSEALHTKEVSPEVGRGLMAVVQSTSDQTGEDMDSLSVTKKLEEELLKRDALIEVCHFDGYYCYFAPAL